MNEQDLTAIADMLVDARRNQEDVGELLAASLFAAAEQLGGVEFLVRGRTGSWEADIVRRMAKAGGQCNLKRVLVLAPLLVKLADGDGGDLLSQAMGKAVDQLGGLETFAGSSQWYWDLKNIGSQYSKNHWNEM